jgi:hypothetical protein
MHDLPLLCQSGKEYGVYFGSILQPGKTIAYQHIPFIKAPRNFKVKTLFLPKLNGNPPWPAPIRDKGGIAVFRSQ